MRGVVTEPRSRQMARNEDRPEALIIAHPERDGDWTVWLPSYPRRHFGHYATRTDAARAARRMGFHTLTKEAS